MKRIIELVLIGVGAAAVAIILYAATTRTDVKINFHKTVENTIVSAVTEKTDVFGNSWVVDWNIEKI